MKIVIKIQCRRSHQVAIAGGQFKQAVSSDLDLIIQQFNLEALKLFPHFQANFTLFDSSENFEGLSVLTGQCSRRIYRKNQLENR